MSEPIELFLSPAGESGQTLEEGLDPVNLAGIEAGEESLAGQEDFVAERSSRHAGGDANSVADQGWAVVIPDNDQGDHLLQVVKPLLDRRSEDMEGDPVEIFRVPPDLDAAQAMQWQDRTFRGNKLEEDIPAYLTVLGDFDEVSVATQRVLSTYSHVGRLGFDDDAGYESYVAKLLRWEKVERQGQARALFFTALDGTAATALGERLLIAPSLADAQALQGKRDFPVSEVVRVFDEEPDEAGELLLEVAGEESPSILFSCSHGMGAPRSGWSSAERQRAMQGALCLGRGEQITADDVRDAPFLPGGMWLYFACYGAGTPAQSEYAHWLANLQKLGRFSGSLTSVMAALPVDDPPFIAALPRAALANPDGPLGVVGHVDLAWSCSFQDLDEDGERMRHRRFQPLLSQMARGSCAGLAFSEFLRTRAQIESEITISEDLAARARALGGDAPDDRVRMGQRWMLHQDLDGYVLLGDPAARLAIDPRSGQRRKRGSSIDDPVAAVSVAVTGSGAPSPEQTSFAGSARDPESRETPEDGPGARGAEDPGGSRAIDELLAQGGDRALGELVRAIATFEVASYARDDDAAPGDDLADDPAARLLARTRCALENVEQVWVTDGDPDLQALHLDLVKQALQSRNELLRLLVAALRGRDLE